jgi:hypothetical protein
MPTKQTAKPKTTTKPKPAPKPKPRLSADGDGVTCIKNLVGNDQRLHRLIIKMQVRKAYLARRGKRNAAMDAQLTKLVKSYNARQQRVRDSKLLKVQTGMAKDVQAMKDWFSDLISGPHVGAPPLVVLVPVAVVVLAGLSYWVYRTFFADEKQGLAELSEAAQLDARYLSMSPEQQQFFDENMQKAYDKGRDDAGGFLSSIKDSAGVLLLGLGAFWFLRQKSAG